MVSLVLVEGEDLLVGGVVQQWRKIENVGVVVVW